MELIEPVLIPCENVEPGMFDDERLVTVRDRESGESVPMFAWSGVLVRRGDRTYIRVTQMAIDEESGFSVCLLPVEGSETPSCTRWVRANCSEVLAA